MSVASNDGVSELRVWPSAAPARRRLLALLAVAGLLRATYLIEYLSLPFVDGPLFDSVVYLRQAESIHAGRLGDPTLVAFSPLYGWFLALFGAEPRLAPLVAQLLLGLATLYLLHRMVAALFDETAALAAAVAWTGYGLVLFYESKLMSETLGLALLVAALTATTSGAYRRGHLGAAAAAGALLAAAVLARASLLFAAPFVVVGAAFAWERSERSSRAARARRSAGLAISFAIVLGGHGLHNLAHTGMFVPVILASDTAARASQATWDGRLDVFGEAPSPWDVVAQARERLARAQRGEPEVPRARFDALGALRGAPRKLALTLRDTETTFDYGYYGERSEVRALSLLPLSFGALACMAALGAAWLVRSRGGRALLFHLPLVLGTLAVTAVFHPSSRYRLPMIVPMVVLAGFAVSRILSLEPGRRRAALAAVLALVVGFAIPTYTTRLQRPAMWHVRVAEAAIVAGWPEEAAARARRARALAGGDQEVSERLERLGLTAQ